MPTESVQNQTAVKNWDIAVNSVQEGSQTVVSPTSSAATPFAPSAAPPEIPSRRAPDAADAQKFEEGLDNLNNTVLLFSIEALGRLLKLISLKQHQIESEARMAETEISQDMSGAAADDLREEGVMSLAGSTVMSLMQITGAAAMIGGGISQAKVSNTMAVSNRMMTFQAASQAISATGSMIQGGLNLEVKKEEAEKVLHEADAAVAKSLEESDNEASKEELQLVQAIIQFLEKLEESRHEAVKATV